MVWFLEITRFGNEGKFVFFSAAERRSWRDVIMEQSKREMVNTDEAKRWALLMVGATCLSASFSKKKNKN